MILPERQNNANPGIRLVGAFPNAVLLCLLLVAVAVVYQPVEHCDFVVYDDPAYFTSNPHVLNGLTTADVAWAFATGRTGNWHPLTWLSLMLDVELFGHGPAGPHFTNLLFHLANTGLLFLLLRCLTAATWRSAFVAALFALHPLHVESVAWISERKDVLSTFFGLLALLFYTGYARRVTGDKWQVTGLGKVIPASFMSRVTCHVSRFYWLALLFFAFSLMSKAMWVTLPLVMLLLDWWPLERFKVQGSRFKVQSLILEKIPFFLLSMVSCVVTFIVQRHAGAIGGLVKVSLAGRIENAFVSYARYLGKTFWPVALANPYPHPGHWELWLVVSAALLVVCLSVAAVWLGRKFPFVPTGWFWFVVTLVPVIGLVQVGVQSMADRYTYAPLIGVFIMVAWGLNELGANRHGLKPAAGILALLLLVACGFRTRDQIGCWQNSGTLFAHTLALTKNNFIAWNNLGTYLAEQGNMTEAGDCCAKSLQINPHNFEAFCNLGNIMTKLGRLDEAMDYYQRALQIVPGHADALSNLGLILMSRKQYAEAIVDFELALKANPDSVSAHNNLAAVLFAQRRFGEAARHYREALRLQPDNPILYSNLGDALVWQGQTAEAVNCYQAALRLAPDDARIRAKLQALGGGNPE
jgi:Tfp pilus assembly protein PilF